MPTTVFFATNRRRTGDGTQPEHYAGETGPAGKPGQITFGRARVGSSNLPGLKPGRLIGLSDISSDKPSPGLEKAMVDGRNLLLFVHGFANGFSAALVRAAFNADWFASAGIPAGNCAVVTFSWPSQGKIIGPAGSASSSLRLALADGLASGTPGAKGLPTDAYRADQAAARASDAHFISILDRLGPTFAAVRQGGGRVFLLAHSMGNLVTSATLERWASMGEVPARLFDEAFSAAADTDWAEGAAGPAWLQHLRRSSGRVSLYHSSADQVLWVSEVVNLRKRLGESGPVDRKDLASYPTASFRFIDCTAATEADGETTLEGGHQYYRRSPAVRDDIARAMAGKGRGGSSSL